MNREATHTLFRAHAAARMRGDTVEAARLASQIGPELRMNQVLFLTALLAGVIVDEYGSQPDPTDLAELTKHLHDKHFPTDPTFNALRAEAMIRAVCGESVLLTEIPFADQPGYIWAVLAELVSPTISDDDLAEHFDLAEEAGLTWMSETLEATVRNYPKQSRAVSAPADGPTSAPPVGPPVASPLVPPVGSRTGPRTAAQVDPAGGSRVNPADGSRADQPVDQTAREATESASAVEQSVDASASQPATPSSEPTTTQTTEEPTEPPAEQRTEPPTEPGAATRTEPGTATPTSRPASSATAMPAKESE